MKILFFTYAFAPEIGGLETVSALLADQFARHGHEIKLVTNTAADPNLDRTIARPYEVIRQPGKRRFLSLFRWCDLYFQNNISLDALWPMLTVRRPWAVAHHSWVVRPDGRTSWRDRLKLRLVPRAACSIAVSRALADTVGHVDAIIGNPFDSSCFRLIPTIPRETKLVYLGRLIPGKGVDVLFQAILQLRARGIRAPLNIIGRGPDEGPLRRLADAMGLLDIVTFLGERSGDELARMLNAHEIMVVPSVFPESYGVVALEGIACGCVVAGTSGGGLPEAIGPCGIVSENGDARGLAKNLARLMAEPLLRTQLRRESASHLVANQASRVALAYLALLGQAARQFDENSSASPPNAHPDA